jgi:hypothetical protein
VLAEDFVIVDANSPSWSTIRPYVEAALRLEQNEGPPVWHGWDRQQINTFLAGLPSPCTLLVAVWEGEDAVEYDSREQKSVSDGDAATDAISSPLPSFVLGCVCEVVVGEVRSIRTFESLQDENLPRLDELVPDYQHAFELMRVVRKLVAPVAWGLFTDRPTWNEWVFAANSAGIPVDKGKLLTDLAQQGRCVLMGSQTTHHHP